MEDNRRALNKVTNKIIMKMSNVGATRMSGMSQKLKINLPESKREDKRSHYWLIKTRKN